MSLKNSRHIYNHQNIRNSFNNTINVTTGGELHNNNNNRKNI